MPRVTATLLLFAWTLIAPLLALADPPEESDPFDFWLSEAFVHRLADEDTIMSRLRVSMNQRTKKVQERGAPSAI
jgi:hypothetical protein